jgi:hypothetical protein
MTRTTLATIITIARPCPSGYRESGGYCAPMTRDPPAAIPKAKGQQCPSGYASGAHYCTRMR